MESERKTASLIFAAGKGSRMKGFEGNKTLLPLMPGKSPFEGDLPILVHILNNLPPGPKAVVVNHKKEDVMSATRSLGITYCEQPSLDGTGGALLAAKKFIKEQDYEQLLITMGDVPFVKDRTYGALVRGLKGSSMMVLGFRPADKKQYGVLETDGNMVRGIIEWKYWSTYPKKRQDQMDICNSGIYAARKKDIIRCLDILEKRPHMVMKERNGKMIEVKEYFITDMIEFMEADGFVTGYIVAEDEDEVMGIDDLPSLVKAQKLFNVHP